MRSLYALAICSVLLISGCGGDGLDRTAISGNVTLGGKPVRSGLVSFRPAAGGSGPAASTPVQDGHYEFSSDNGPVVGKYDVAIMIGSDEGKKSGPRKGSAGGNAEAPAGAVIMLRDIEITSGSMVKDLALEASMINQN